MHRSLKLIVGLGNPGRRHERDRHNVGFRFVSRLAAIERVDLKEVVKYHGILAKLTPASGDVWLLLPQTYMNLSGKAVGALARFYKIQADETLVAHDELDFSPGTAKLKFGGGVAGHNGLKDIAAQLGTQGFWRLRIGIGHPGDKNLVSDYVLNSPTPPERELIESAVARCLEISGLLIEGNMEAAMLRLHTKS